MIFKAQEFSFRCYDWTDCKPLQMALSSSVIWKLLDDVTLRFPSATPRVVFVGHGQHLVRRMVPFWKRWSRPSKERHQWVWFSSQTVEGGRELENLLERKENEYSSASNEQNEASKCYRASIHQLSTWSAFTVRGQHCCQAGRSPWIVRQKSFQIWCQMRFLFKFDSAQNGTGHHPARGMDLSQVLRSKLHRLSKRVDCSFGSYRYLLAHPHVPLRAINQVQTPDIFFWDLEWWVLEGSIVTRISLNQFWRQDFAVQAGNLKRKDIQMTLTETCETTHWSGTALLLTLASKTKQKN